MVDYSSGSAGDGAVWLVVWRIGHAFVELAHAHAVRLAPDHILASPGTPGTEPDPRRRAGRRRFQRLKGTAALRAALGMHDAGRARAIQGMDAQSPRRDRDR